MADSDRSNVPGRTEPATRIDRFLQGAELALLNERLPGFLPAQRWFGGKSRTLTSAKIASSIFLADGAFALTTVDVAYSDGSTDVYQLPLAIASGEQAGTLRASAPKAVLLELGERREDAIVFDASHSAEFRKLLLTLVASSASTADLGASTSLAADLAGIAGETSRVGSAEQSNTSLLYGQTAILKLFRRLQPGENPDVEICRFLTDIALYRYIPAYLGELHRTADGATLGFLQAFAPNQGDGWDWFQEQLTAFHAAVLHRPPPPSLGAPASFGSSEPVLDAAQEYAGASLEAAALLGRRTAEMHLALATPTGDAAFAAVAATAADMAADSERLERQTRTALAALERTLPTLAADVLPDARSLLARTAELARIAAPPSEHAGFGQRTRIHGDFHLGQTLRAHDDFLLVDFEGEPAKPLAERRSKQSPLRDVAGMLRSFSYAARSALLRQVPSSDEQATSLSAWTALWENAVSATFLQQYAAIIHQNPDLLPNDAQSQLLLQRYLLEKALYELLYELNNRPTWVAIPLSGLLALLS